MFLSSRSEQFRKYYGGAAFDIKGKVKFSKISIELIELIESEILIIVFIVKWQFVLDFVKEFAYVSTRPYSLSLQDCKIFVISS